MSDEEKREGTLRLAQYLAHCGVCLRRNAGDIINANRVSVNGEVTADHSRRVAVGVDGVTMDGRAITPPARGSVILVMNKPTGVVVTRSDPNGRKTVYDVLPIRYGALARSLVYAGRLDADTSGLLILTTDGDLANRLMHPSFHLEKTYEAKIN